MKTLNTKNTIMKNSISKINNAITVIAIVCFTLIFNSEVNAQAYAPLTSATTFYSSANGTDLHYNFGWTRSASTVTFDNSNKSLEMASGSAKWFQTTNLLINPLDNISFTFISSNNASNTRNLNVDLINPSTNNVEYTLLALTDNSTPSLRNSNSTNVSIVVPVTVNSGDYKIRFTYSTATNSTLQISNFSTDAGLVALPVVINEFITEKTNNGVSLNWSTVSEINNSHFEIERSTNGTEWTMLGTVNGSGNSSELIIYEYTDMNPKSGVNYYRLKQVDFNGDVHYSKLTEVIMNTVKSEQVKIYPNPAVSFVNIDVPSTVETVTTEIRTIDGRVIKSETFSNTSKATVSVQDLIPGVYYMHVQMGSQTIVKTVLKN
jgi:hypothetical protein